jgi:hypothetical protein
VSRFSKQSERSLFCVSSSLLGGSATPSGVQMDHHNRVRAGCPVMNPGSRRTSSEHFKAFLNSGGSA